MKSIWSSSGIMSRQRCSLLLETMICFSCCSSNQNLRRLHESICAMAPEHKAVHTATLKEPLHASCIILVQVRLHQILKEQGNEKATMAERMLKMQMQHVGNTEKVNQQKRLLEWTQVSDLNTCPLKHLCPAQSGLSMMLRVKLTRHGMICMADWMPYKSKCSAVHARTTPAN